MQLNFRAEIPTLDEQKEKKYAPVDGIIKYATLHFPPGCNSLVESFIYHKKKRVLPNSRKGIALDDATKDFEINEKVEMEDQIQVKWVNHDDSFSHTLSTIIIINTEPILYRRENNG